MIISINNVLEYQIDSEEFLANTTTTTTTNHVVLLKICPFERAESQQTDTRGKKKKKKSHLFKIDPTIALNTRDVTSQAKKKTRCTVLLSPTRGEKVLINRPSVRRRSLSWIANLSRFRSHRRKWHQVFSSKSAEIGKPTCVLLDNAASEHWSTQLG